MKLQRQLSRKVGDKEYDKWVLVLSPTTIQKIGWKEGSELKAYIKDGKLIIKKQD